VRTYDHNTHWNTNRAANKSVPLHRKFCVATLKKGYFQIVVNIEVYQQDDKSCVDHWDSRQNYCAFVDLLRDWLVFFEVRQFDKNHFADKIQEWYHKWRDNCHGRCHHVLWYPILAVVYTIWEIVWRFECVSTRLKIIIELVFAEAVHQTLLLCGRVLIIL